MIPNPDITVVPITMLGTVSLTGAAGVKLTVGTERLAPQRLQYFNSTVISLPQDGQYTQEILLGSPANLTLSEESGKRSLAKRLVELIETETIRLPVSGRN